MAVPHHWPELLRRAYLATLLVVLVVALAPIATPGSEGVDKMEHLVAFYGLGLGGAIAFPRLHPIAIVAALTAFGVMIEAAQGLPFIGRDREAMDVVANFAGAAFAALPFTLAWLRTAAGSRDASLRPKTAAAKPSF